MLVKLGSPQEIKKDCKGKMIEKQDKERSDCIHLEGKLTILFHISSDHIARLPSHFHI